MGAVLSKQGSLNWDMSLPGEFVLSQEICVIQLFGQNLLERIPTRAVVFADRPSSYTRMIEVVWQGKRYAMFQRDLEDRTRPV